MNRTILPFFRTSEHFNAPSKQSFLQISNDIHIDGYFQFEKLQEDGQLVAVQVQKKFTWTQW